MKFDKSGKFFQKAAYTLLLAVGMMSIIATSGSSVSISRFDVRPSHICSGNTVNIEWETTGDTVEISKSPGSLPARFSSLSATGSETDSVSGDTRYTLTASNSSNSSSQQKDVTVIPPAGRDYTIGALGQCTGGIPVWKSVQAPEEWDAGSMVTTVVNASSQDIIVTKGASVIGLPVGGSTAAFSGQSVSGDWSMAPATIDPRIVRECECQQRDASSSGSTAPIPDTSCSLTDRRPPGSLAINVTVQCR